MKGKLTQLGPEATPLPSMLLAVCCPVVER